MAYDCHLIRADQVEGGGVRSVNFGLKKALARFTSRDLKLESCVLPYLP